jgi:hypothetical protein
MPRKVRLVDVWTEDHLGFSDWADSSILVAERYTDWVIENEYRNRPESYEQR